MRNDQNKDTQIEETRERILDDLKRARAFLRSAERLCKLIPAWALYCEELTAIELKLIAIEGSVGIPAPEIREG